jgi:zinc transport system permease protein
MIIDFFIHAMLAGMMLALIAAPLGCFVVWRKMSYFGDAIAHSSLLGVVLGLTFDVPLLLTIVPIAMLLAVVLNKMQSTALLSVDTLLGVLAHISLASGVVLLALNPTITVDIMAYLFGDILAVSESDLMTMSVLSFLVTLTLWWAWKPLMMMTVSEELAQIRGVKVDRYRLLLMLMIAVTVAVSIKLVGLLLITSMLILPAAVARYYSRSPLQMLVTAIFIALIAIGGGLYSSFLWDTPTGPSIVLAAGAMFIMAYLSSHFSMLRKKRGLS